MIVKRDENRVAEREMGWDGIRKRPQMVPEIKIPEYFYPFVDL